MMEFQGGFKDVLEHLQARKEKEWVGIPQKYSKLESIIPYYEKSQYILISAHSGVGKTIFTISDWIIYPYLFSRKTNYKVKIFYFSLEKSKVIVKSQILSNLYYQDTKSKVSKQDLFSNRFDENTFDNLKELSKLYHDLDEKVTIIDNLYGVGEIQAYMKKYFEANGKVIIDPNNSLGKKYIPNDDTHVIIITDTINALNLLQGKSKSETLNYYSREVSKNQFCELYGATKVAIQQQDKDAEKNSFTFKGEINYQATMPSRNSLSESKLTFNDADFVQLLYAPSLYGVPKYPFTKEAWDISRLKDHFRAFILAKSRDGASSVEMGLYSNLAVNYFEQLPRPEEFDKNDDLYKFYENK